MTPDQIKMARHALGLDVQATSYRNRYVAGLGSPHEASWDDLVRQGLAERGKNGVAVVGFCLTDAGARAVLGSGETLDLEDFPSYPINEDPSGQRREPMRREPVDDDFPF